MKTKLDKKEACSTTLEMLDPSEVKAVSGGLLRASEFRVVSGGLKLKTVSSFNPIDVGRVGFIGAVGGGTAYAA